MAKLAEYGDDGLVCGWHDTDRPGYHPGNIPTRAIVLTEAQWAARTIGYYAIADGNLISAAPPQPHTIVHHDPDPRDKRIADLEARLAALEAKSG